VTPVFSHVGILVASLEQAMDRFSRALGIEFLGPIERSSSTMIDAQGLLRRNGEPTAVYFAPGTLHGLRFELVDGRLRENFFELLGGGKIR